PPGYVGYEEGGQLTEIVRRRPYSVILLDEIEKAHPDVFNVLLQLLDDGRLTDGQGRTVDFRNTLIIMTSNIGSEIFGTEQSEEATEEYVKEALKRNFRPEFLNRVDDTVIFHALGEAEIREIARIQIGLLSERLNARRITLKLTDAALARIAEEGYAPEYGARPLKRAIQRMIMDPLARELLEGNVHEDSEVIVDVDSASQGLTFRTAMSEAA
ncbi:MAG: AAA family ATPase, partial [Candidatus Hydrogenedentota bacterium]